MRIAIPTDGRKGMDDTVSQHFGRCLTYTFLDEEGELLEIIENSGEHRGGTVKPPHLLKEHEADVLLCRGLGPRAIRLFDGFGIEVYVCQAQTVKEIFHLWKEKKLSPASENDACREHRH